MSGGTAIRAKRGDEKRQTLASSGPRHKRASGTRKMCPLRAPGK
jgi:hypothetical protein